MPKELPTIYVKPAAGQEVVVESTIPHKVVSVNSARTRTRFRFDGTYVEPLPPPPPPPTTGDGYILMPRSELMARPTSGVSWDYLKSWADKPITPKPNLSDQNGQGEMVAFAKALVFARTGTAKYRDDCITMLKSAVGTENPGDTLGMVRNFMPLVLAADLIGWHDAAWTTWVQKMQTWPNPDRGYTIRSTHQKRPNNWGGHGGASRIASDWYLGDVADLQSAAYVFAGFCGDRASYASFVYGDLMWQADPTKPVGINPVGAVVGGINADGIIPDDMRRGNEDGSKPPKIGQAGVDYTWESLQGWLLQAELLTRAGYAAYSWSDRAILRAVVRINALGHPAEGDDRWQPWLINARLGTTYPTERATTPGKGFGFADWLYG